MPQKAFKFVHIVFDFVQKLPELTYTALKVSFLLPEQRIRGKFKLNRSADKFESFRGYIEPIFGTNWKSIWHRSSLDRVDLLLRLLLKLRIKLKNQAIKISSSASIKYFLMATNLSYIREQ